MAACEWSPARSQTGIDPGASRRAWGGAAKHELQTVRCEAALGNHGGFFHFWRSIEATEKPARLLVGGACVRLRGAEALTAKHSVLTRANGVRLPAAPRLPDSGSALLGDRPTAGQQVLTLSIEVRILVPERLRCATQLLSDNQIVDDARGRAPPRPQHCPCSRSGDGACPNSRRRWFDSRPGHQHECTARVPVACPVLRDVAQE